MAAARSLRVIVGVISAPKEFVSREWKRAVFAPYVDAGVALRFVLGRPALHADEIAVNVSETVRFACAKKTYMWYQMAPRLFPDAQVFAKADDDTYVFPDRLAAAVASVVGATRPYMGRFLPARFRIDAMSLCYGDCTRCHMDRCPVSTPVGPVASYMFAAGGFHAVGADLAREIGTWGAFWGVGRRAIVCAHEDAALGFFIHSRTNATHVPLAVVDVQDLHLRPAQTPVAVHRALRTRDRYERRARRERVQNEEFRARGIPAQHHVQHLRDANAWFIDEVLRDASAAPRRAQAREGRRRPV